MVYLPQVLDQSELHLLTFFFLFTPLSFCLFHRTSTSFFYFPFLSPLSLFFILCGFFTVITVFSFIFFRCFI